MNKDTLPKLDWARIETLIKLALEEDIGGGDVTSVSIIPKDLSAAASLICREKCICAGLPVSEAVFRAVDPNNIGFFQNVKDGTECRPNTILAEVEGPARALLAAERTALNFLQRLCGIATLSRKYSSLLQNSNVIILDTRKTTPGWRNLEKYAVAVGGSSNHRFGLYDRIMIKDNHRKLAGMEKEGGIALSVNKAKKAYPDLEIEVEADTLAQVNEAAEARADYILLDNMSDEEIAEAVKINAGRAKLEASGGITLERIPSLEKLGIDYISVGALTHSVKSMDISMEIKTKSFGTGGI